MGTLRIKGRRKNVAEIEIDDQRWPLLTFTYPTEMSMQACVGHMARILEYLERGELFAMVTDTSGASQLTLEQRRYLGKILRERHSEFAKYLICQGGVVTSRLTRAIYTGLGWMVNFPYPLRLFASVHEADAYCVAELRNRGVMVPDLLPTTQLPPSSAIEGTVP